jgi:predicted nucleic acid-binding protein
LVIDASVLVKAFVAEALSDGAAEIVFSGSILLMPDHGLAEFAEVMRRHAKSDIISREHLDRALTAATSLVTRRPIPPILPRAVEIALAIDASVYDTLYIALAEHEGVVCVTADRRLLRAATETPFARWLAPLSSARG